VILRLVCWLFLLGSPINTLHSQSLFLGVRTIFSLGSHDQRVGLGLCGTMAHSQFLVSFGSDFSYSYASLGGRKRMWEAKSYLGLAWKGKSTLGLGDFEQGILRNPFSRSSILGYAYLWYYDNVGTRQSSGAFRGEYLGHSLYFENDFFAGKGKDRYRTAMLFYRYRNNNWSINSGIILWTGETSGLQIREHSFNGKAFFYKDLSASAYGKTAHGIFFSGCRYGVSGQSLGIDVGIDSERIRNLCQNTIAHNSLWHRKKPQRACRYPMLDASGYPRIHGQPIRESIPYFRFSLSGDS